MNLTPERIAELAKLYRYKIDVNPPTCWPPEITYQYSEEGGICTSHGAPEMLWTPTVQDDFRTDFFRQWGAKAEQAWNRLHALMAQQLERLPDNPFSQRDAWMVGIGDGGPHVAGYRGMYDTWVAALLEAETRDVAKQERKQFLEQNVSMRVLKTLSDGVEVLVSSLQGDEELKFCCRNIFDFGYVVNPAYSILPGGKPGGVVNDGQWMDYVSGEGWHNVRPLTEFERIAIEYLYRFPPVNPNIRM